MDFNIGPAKSLPYTDDFSNNEGYVESLLDLVGGNDLLRTLCGGVHILDFFTSTPSLYSRILPEDWRTFFDATDIMDILDLLMREDLCVFDDDSEKPISSWKEGPLPPKSLIEYIAAVRKHLLNREISNTQCARNRAMKPTQKLQRHVAVGMNVKKIHEVGLFASYIANLASEVSSHTGHDITHLVDFGSGQNYLGRALASEPYNKNIIAIESKLANAERAKELDVMARLLAKQKVMRNKKAFRAGLNAPGSNVPQPLVPVALPTPPPEESGDDTVPEPKSSRKAPGVEIPSSGRGVIQYVEHLIEDGDLQDVVAQMPSDVPKNLMVMSLHSCGNLVHHGLRSMVLNPEVKAVAMVGCCYNLATERLGPATYKLPELRPTTFAHPRLESTGQACDPHGFPMSDRFCRYTRANAGRAESGTEESSLAEGLRLNITCRMMAVQAPFNWGVVDSERFFPRHYYRALLQRVFLDRGVIGPPRPACVGVSSPAGHSSGGTPIIIGSMRKTCFHSFVSYVREALVRLAGDPERGQIFQEKVGCMTDEEIAEYDRQYIDRKKEVSIMWSLMAFSAGAVEAAIVVDRWLWMKEQEEIRAAWVEPVFDYKMSPRNLVVVGVKK